MPQVSANPSSNDGTPAAAPSRVLVVQSCHRPAVHGYLSYSSNARQCSAPAAVGGFLLPPPPRRSVAPRAAFIHGPSAAAPLRSAVPPGGAAAKAGQVSHRLAGPDAQLANAVWRCSVASHQQLRAAGPFPRPLPSHSLNYVDPCTPGAGSGRFPRATKTMQSWIGQSGFGLRVQLRPNLPTAQPSPNSAAHAPRVDRRLPDATHTRVRGMCLST